MSGAQGVSGERLSSLLGHVTHRGFDDLVDPKNQGIAYPTGNVRYCISSISILVYFSSTILVLHYYTIVACMHLSLS